MQKLVKVDGRVRSDPNYPAGFMGKDNIFTMQSKDELRINQRLLLDVVSIEKTKENFRLLYDTKGRFILHRIDANEAGVSILCTNLFVELFVN